MTILFAVLKRLLFPQTSPRTSGNLTSNCYDLVCPSRIFNVLLQQRLKIHHWCDSTLTGHKRSNSLCVTVLIVSLDKMISAWNTVELQAFLLQLAIFRREITL